VCSASNEDHHCEAAAVICNPHPSAAVDMTPGKTLSYMAVESDLRPNNTGASCISKKMTSQKHQHLIVDTAMLRKNMPQRQTEREREFVVIQSKQTVCCESVPLCRNNNL